MDSQRKITGNLKLIFDVNQMHNNLFFKLSNCLKHKVVDGVLKNMEHYIFSEINQVF